MNFRDLLIVKPKSKVNLSDIAADFTNSYGTRERAEEATKKHVERLGVLQYLLYAENRRSLLICLQGLDASGKDGTIRHVFRAVNPQGARVQSFKVPSKLEASHDFLWRAHAAAPANGELVVFNRSHYEDVLVGKAHDTLSDSVLRKRYERIIHFERNLTEHGTCVLKFYLHISPEEQLERFHQRLEDPLRQWKISESDYAERQYWPAYKKAHEDALAKTSTHDAPWFIVPSDRKWFRNLAISEILVRTLESFEMKTPDCTVDLAAIRKKYHSAVRDQKKAAKKR